MWLNCGSTSIQWFCKYDAPPSAAEESLRNEHIGEYDHEQLEYYEFIDYPAEDWSFEPQL